ncbi:MAG: endonuclease/exonuclease/phosphatase family protein [Opitutales bacterium]
MRLFCLAILLPLILICTAFATDFEVVAYNLENLFDVDAVAEFEDYQPGILGERSYGPRHLLTKLDNTRDILQRATGPEGPDIILFQELELDRTPSHPVETFPDLLEKYAETTAAEMLTSGELDPEAASLPAAFWLLKHLSDQGLGPYEVALPPILKPLEEATAHTNAIFSKFPITASRGHATERARAIQEVELDINGARFIIFNNHWKSGASNASTEAIRVGNARVLRAAVDSVLSRDPKADVLIGGDLNTHYNADQVFRREWDLDTFAIEVLGSTGDERAVAEGRTEDFYNLWFELPVDQRRSDFYRGSWGTLMQFLVTPGLYDPEGVVYLDGSFDVLEYPGVNTAGPFNRPRGWTFLGKAGGGYSDHLPIIARFTTSPEPGAFGMWSTWKRERTPRGLLSGEVDDIAFQELPSAKLVTEHPESEWPKAWGTLFAVEGRWDASDGWEIFVNGHRFGVWTPLPDLKETLSELKSRDRVRFIGEFGEFRAQEQFVILAEDWWLN